MAKLKLLNTIFSKLGSLTKNNGQIIVTRDSKSLYVDLEGERIEITDWIDIDTEENLLAILTPLTNKYYYTKDSNKVWRYIGGEWKCLNDSADDLAPTYTESSTLLKLSSGEKLSVAFGKISKAITDLISHIGDSVKHITSTERTNWNSAKTHADSAHAPSNAQVNVIETIKVNGTALTPSSKAVNITVPTNNNQLTNGAGYITSSGTAKTISDTLPISKGGTGKTTAKAAEYNILSDMTESTDNPNDDSLITYTYVNPSETQGKLYWRKASTLWNYIKSKLATVATSGSYNDLKNKPTIPTVGNGTVTIKQAGTSKGTFTMNQSGNTTIELTDSNTTYGVATSSALGLVKSGTDITVDSSGNVSVNDDSHNHVISNVDGLQSTLDGKLSKTTYEYNKELALGSSGKVCIGVFPCYDSNISVEIKSTTNTTYNGTLVIATQNINTTGGGVYTATVFGDEKNTLTSAIKIQYTSGSNAFSVYINLPSWSKNLLHIQCVSLAGTPSSIATRVDSIPSTATIVPTNAFTHTHNYAGSSSAGGSATSAVKLDSSAGSATQPVYFSSGKPVACTYTLGKSVPSNAVFTDTNTWRGIQNNLTSDSTTDSLSAAQGKVLKGLVDGKAASSHSHDYLPLSGGTITGGLLNIRFSGSGNWNEGIRIHESNNWATIALCSSDNTGDTGTSANTWSIHNNKGNFYITRNGSNSSSSAILSCINNSWSINGNAIIHAGNIGSQSVNYASSAGNADTVDGHHFNWSGQGGQPTWVWGGNDSSNMYVYNPSNFSVNYANRAGTVTGSYTGNGGQQNPNYFGVNKVGFLMMNTTVNGDNHYKDWIIMDCYSGNDVGGATAIGVDRQEMRAFIMGSNANRTSWTRSAELITTSNIGSQSVSNANTLSGFTNTTTTGTAVNNATRNGHVYVNDTSGIGFSNDGACYVQAYSTSWVHQIYGDYRTGQIAVRGKNNGTWQAWRKVLDSSNYTSYCTPANIGAATASHTHSNYLTGITKDMVTTALGYTPPTKDTNTWRPLGTTADTACAGNDSRLSNARPASDVYSWAKASSKPSYSWSEIKNKPSTFTPASHNHELIIDSNDRETPIFITFSKDELAYDGFTYLTAWYGYELRKIPKTLFATASHTHSYLPLSGGTVSGTITADNLQSKNGLTLTNTYSTADASIKCYWKDNSLHEIVTRNSNGLSSYFGWAGSSRYSTTTWLRGQTCKYQNASGTATLSDVRMKKDFRGLDVYDKFFDAIEPCAFRMTNGSSGRYHIGYKAQQIEQALIDSGLTTQDFAGFIRMPYTIDKEDKNGTKAHEEAGIKEGDDELSIIYTEFAAMNTYQIQKCKKEISNLKNEIAELKNIISNLNA